MTIDNLKNDRTVSKMISIRDIIGGTYVQEQENEPNYLLTIKKEKIYRCNIMATILTKEKNGFIINFTVDDGSGIIVVRSFEINKLIEELKVGDTILIIGKIRVYNNDKYVSPEILKKIDPIWLKTRIIPKNFDKPEEIVKHINSSQNTEEIIEEEIIDNMENFPFQKIIKLIKELDNGEGVFIDNILEKSSLKDTEKIIEKMMERGEIFQIGPGRVKVL